MFCVPARQGCLPVLFLSPGYVTRRLPVMFTGAECMLLYEFAFSYLGLSSEVSFGLYLLYSN